MVSFTITEKGYALRDAKGEYFPFIRSDIDNGPDKASSAMAVVSALLYERFNTCKAPLAVVSMDNWDVYKRQLLYREEPFMYSKDSITYKEHILVFRNGRINRKCDIYTYEA